MRCPVSRLFLSVLSKKHEASHYVCVCTTPCVFSALDRTKLTRSIHGCATLQNATAILHCCTASRLWFYHRPPISGPETVCFAFSSATFSKITQTVNMWLCRALQMPTLRRYVFLSSLVLSTKGGADEIYSALFHNPRFRGHVCTSVFEYHWLYL
jgi:hypothetical protein